MSLPHLFVLVDDDAALPVVAAVAEAGVDGFQVRAKDATDRELFDLTRRVVAAVRPAAATVVVDDRVDVGLAAGADGVHVGADDLPVDAVRALAPDLLLGATCRSRSDVEAAARAGASYAGFGPVFASGSKEGLPEPLGPAAVRDAAGVLPLIAIGGITAATASEVRAAGAHGVAVIGAIWNARDPVAAAKELVEAAV